MNVYELEVYDEEFFKKNFPEMYQEVCKNINVEEYDFSQCLKYNNKDNYDVLYIRADDEDVSCNFLFDDNFKLLSSEIEED